MKSMIRGIFVAAIVAVCATEARAADLPAPDDVNASWYGDGLVYSLGLLNLIATNNASELNGPFTVASSAGQISNQLVILSGSSGNLVDNNVAPSGPLPANSTVADNPFHTPSGQQGTAFTTQQGHADSAAEPAPAITNDNSNSWDVRVTDLLNFLNGANLVYYFDNNQEGGVEGIRLNIWAQIQLVDDQGVLPTLCFEIHGTATGDKTAGGSAAPPGGTCSGGPGFDPATVAPNNNYVLVDSGFCVDKITGLSEACENGNQPGPGQWGQVTNNLGNSRAEFALTIPDLNDCLQDPQCLAGYDVLRHIIFFSNNTDGPEQAWISAFGSSVPPPVVPVPAPLLLLGAGLVGLTIGLRRRAR